MIEIVKRLFTTTIQHNKSPTPSISNLPIPSIDEVKKRQNAINSKMRTRTEITRMIEQFDEQQRIERESKQRNEKQPSRIYQLLSGLGVTSTLLLMFGAAATSTIATAAVAEVASTIIKKIPFFFMRRPKPPTFMQRTSHRLLGDTRFYNSKKPETLPSPFRKMLVRTSLLSIVPVGIFLSTNRGYINMNYFQDRLFPNTEQPNNNSQITERNNITPQYPLNFDLIRSDLSHARNLLYSGIKDMGIYPSCILDEDKYENRHKSPPRA